MHHPHPVSQVEPPRRLTICSPALAILLLLLACPLAARAQTNLALSGVATQSSDWVDADGPAVAERAIDGDRNGAFASGSVSHTAGGSDSVPFWEVDLGQDRQIDDIVIWNRTDACCAARLYDFTVSVRNEGSGSFLYGPFPPPVEAGFPVPLGAGGVVGRFVTVSLAFDPGNQSERYLSLAEVEVFGPLEDGELPLGTPLLLNGRWNRKLNSTVDGPKKAVEKLLDELRKAGIRRSKVPKKCSESEDGITLGQIRFDSDETDHFQMSTIDGQVVFGTWAQGGSDGKDVTLRVDEASERSFQRMLQKSASDCFELDAGEKPTEKLKKLRTKLKSYTLEGRVENGTFSLTAKIKGSVQWTSKVKKLGKLKGSGKATHKLTISAPLDQSRTSIPTACLVDQGAHVYPRPGAQFEGWIELTEIQGSDRYYLILSDDFVSILEDFQDGSQVVRALLTLLDREGSACNLPGRSVLSVTLTEFGKDNFLYVIDYLEQIELQITAFVDYIEQQALMLAFEVVFGGSPTGDFANELFQCFIEETTQEIFDDEEIKNKRCKNGFP